MPSVVAPEPHDGLAPVGPRPTRGDHDRRVGAVEVEDRGLSFTPGEADATHAPSPTQRLYHAHKPEKKAENEQKSE